MNKQNGIFINDINGEVVEVTDLNKAIKQCELCKKSTYLMLSGYTVGENHKHMLGQLMEIKKYK